MRSLTSASLALCLLAASSQPAMACMNAMAEEHETDLVWLLLPAVFLLAMLGASVYLVLRTHGKGAEKAS